jgi:hypothetical protein
MCILAMHSRFIGCLPLEKSIKNESLIIINALSSIVNPILSITLE